MTSSCEKMGMTKGFRNVVEGTEKGATCMARKFRTSKITVWMKFRILEMICEEGAFCMYIDIFQ